MAMPSFKTVEMERTLMQLFGTSRLDCIHANVCVPPPVGCGGPAIEFKNELSRKDYTITGMCQKCQDEFYKE